MLKFDQSNAMVVYQSNAMVVYQSNAMVVYQSNAMVVYQSNAMVVYQSNAMVIYNVYYMYSTTHCLAMYCIQSILFVVLSLRLCMFV